MDKNLQVKYYEDLLDKYGDHYLSLDWKAPDSQRIRYSIFEDLINMFSAGKFSLLDVGCGFGDLYGFLKERNYDVDYTGVDIAPKIIDMAKKKYPEAKFEVKDILSDKKNSSYDFVFLSGALSICFDDREKHIDFIISMLIKMYELCKIAVGVNFLSSEALYAVSEEDLQKKQYFYMRPEEAVSIVKTLSKRFVLRHDYHLGDFTVYIIKT